MKTLKWILLGFGVLGVLVLVAYYCFGCLTLKEEALSGPNIVGYLSTLLFITVLMERSLEVLVTTWRGPQAQILESEVNRLSSLPLSDEYKKAVNELNGYKQKTQGGVLWVALGLGMLVSVAGVRTIEPLVSNFDDLKQIQPHLFRAMDILLTGGLIAGGSDAFHKPIQIYTDFMNATSAKIKAANSNSATGK